MKQKLYIASCTEAGRGKNKAGRPWVLFLITDQNGKRYSTFEERYQASVGSEIEVEVQEVEKDGKKYLNIVEPRKPQGNYATRDDLKSMEQWVLEKIEELKLEIGLDSKIQLLRVAKKVEPEEKLPF